MRAAVRKKRLRGSAGKPGTPARPVPVPDTGTGPGANAAAGGDRTGRRPARVRNRLMGAVAVVAVAVAGAGAPGISAAVDDTHTSQRLVDLAQLDARAIALSHSLADERDVMTSYVATGRGGNTAAGYESLRARVDRQLRDLRAAAQGAAGETAVYAAAEKQLATLAQTRQEALAGPVTADATYEAYTRTLQALGAIADDIARSLPGRADAADAGTRALPALGRADRKSVV